MSTFAKFLVLLAAGPLLMPGCESKLGVAPANPAASPKRVKGRTGEAFRPSVVVEVPRNVSTARIAKTAVQRHPSYGIQCGDSSCRPGQQVCCLGDEESHCIGVQRDRYAECSNGFRACDDSNDCRQGAVCRDVGAEYRDVVCEPLGDYATATFEVCTPGSDCRTPGTSCKEGLCRGQRPNVSIPCGNSTCGGPQPVCCISNEDDSRHCAESCEFWERDFGCRDVRDCPFGERCLVAPLATNSAENWTATWVLPAQRTASASCSFTLARRAPRASTAAATAPSE